MFRNSAETRQRLWRKLAKLISNGVPVIDALTSIYDRRFLLHKGKDPVSIAVKDWIEKLKNGQRISEAIRGWVDDDEYMLVAAGEQSGMIEEALGSVVNIITSKRKIRMAVISGTMYPALMLIIAFMVLIMFSYKIIPEFAKIVPDDKWQGSARIMIDLANFSRDWLPFIIVAILAMVVAFVLSLSRWSEGLRIKLDRYPPYSIYRMVLGSTWMISLAALVEAGVRVENALQQLALNASPWMQNRIQACLRGMRAGLHAGDALAKTGYGFPDPEIIDDLGVYARLSGFDEALRLLGKEWITESVESIQRMMKIVFGVSVLLVGLFVAFMVGGLIGMELQMSSILQGAYR